MKKVIDNNKCNGCSACAMVCPTKAITMTVLEDGFKYPIIDQDKCIDCNLCRKTCPVLNIKEKTKKISAYACYNKDLETRLNSSSGGLFTLLAHNILKQNGIVFGAMFDSNFKVKHDYIDKVEDIYKFRGSKYVQSDIGKSFEQTKKFLKENTLVLFTGTPCQIEGLLHYLNKDYDNLITQDIICHGVPSPKVWQKYLEYIKYKDLEKISFRDKTTGWENYSLMLKYKDKTSLESHNTHPFMRLFLQNIILRDSCYDCVAKLKHRNSDITLADFWGINNIEPTMNDKKGTSLVLVNSSKGEKIFKDIKDDIVFKKVNFDLSIAQNPSMFTSSPRNPKRTPFFKDLDTLDFEDLIKKYKIKISLKQKIKNKLKKMLKKTN